MSPRTRPYARGTGDVSSLGGRFVNFRSMSFEPAGWRAARWARNPHAQTLAARVLRPDRGPVFRRERLETPDGDFLDVDWGPDPGPHAPVVLVLHGLEGSSRRGYVRSVARELLAREVRPVALNFRGCGGEPNRTLRFYHSGETGDPAFVLEEVRRRHPGRRVGALGFSLGGNVLLKLLGERADGGPGLVSAAAVMSVPYDLAAGCAHLERTVAGRFYAGFFLRSLKAKVVAKAAALAGAVDLEAVARARTIREFDDLVTAPLHGFADAADYYERSSSARFLAGIRVPTLLMHARDDPFLPAEAIPLEEVARNANLMLSLQEAGGHVGFLAGPPWKPRFWADEEVARFLAYILRTPNATAPSTGVPGGTDVP